MNIRDELGSNTPLVYLPEPWFQPQDFFGSKESIPFPTDALPREICEAVLEVQSFVQAPIPLVVSSALSALSVAGQTHVNVERAPGLTGPCSLFFLTVADSGERKSTCDSFFTKTISSYEEYERLIASDEIKAYEASLEAWQSKSNGVKAKITSEAKSGNPTEEYEKQLQELHKQKPKAPKVPRVLYSDVTPEELASQLATAWPSAAIISAEAGAVFGSHGMGRDSIMRNLAMQNSLWDGGCVSFDRRTTESIKVVGAKLSISLQIQSDTLRDFLSKNGTLARGTGYLARFLVCWPKSTQGTRSYVEPPEFWPALTAYQFRLRALLDITPQISDDGSVQSRMISLSADAKKRWIEFHDHIESKLLRNGELFDVRDIASKAADNVVRLAALMSLYSGDSHEIEKDYIDRSAEIIEWYLYESLRFYSEFANYTSEAADLDSWLIRKCREEGVDCLARARILQSGPTRLRKAEKLDQALDELVSLHRVRRMKHSTEAFIEVNPRLLNDVLDNLIRVFSD